MHHSSSCITRSASRRGLSRRRVREPLRERLRRAPRVVEAVLPRCSDGFSCFRFDFVESLYLLLPAFSAQVKRSGTVSQSAYLLLRSFLLSLGFSLCLSLSLFLRLGLSLFLSLGLSLSSVCINLFHFRRLCGCFLRCGLRSGIACRLTLGLGPSLGARVILGQHDSLRFVR